tara:strand:- start:313 stop:597 length:285 start_codon:yes stop_codon:yes gene_type:complete
VAAGDFTVTLESKDTTGRFHRISGTAEVDGTKRAFDLFPGGFINSFSINGKDEAGSVQVDMNEDASGTEDGGNIALQSDVVPVGTYNWTAEYVI